MMQLYIAVLSYSSIDLDYSSAFSLYYSMEY